MFAKTASPLPPPASLASGTLPLIGVRSTRFSAWRSQFPRLELTLGLLLTLVALGLRGLQAVDAGALWRDEVVSVRVATMPSFLLLWRYLEFDSYPPLFHLLLRGWGSLFGTGDFSLRALGLMVGGAILTAFWAAARIVGCRVPLLALTLLGLSSTMVRFGDSVRAYGLGCALVVLMLAQVWRVVSVDRVEARRVVVAMLTAVLAVQCLYHNAMLVCAACLGGAAVAVAARRWRQAVAALAVGLPAALSLLPYLPTIRRTRDWAMLAKALPATFNRLWTVVGRATDVPLAPCAVWVWVGLICAAFGWVAWRLFRGRGSVAGSVAAVRPQVFAAVTLGVAVVAYTVFLRVLDYATQPWYYLPLLSVVALCLDMALGQARDEPTPRLLRVCTALLLGGVLLATAEEWPRLRSTNLDLIADQVNREAAPGDLVVVNRWECAITFERYYHGAAPVLSVPVISDHAVHRYDLMKPYLLAPDPLRPVYEAAAVTLRRGGKVWLVAGTPWQMLSKPVPPIPPVQPGLAGVWPLELYTQAWSIQVADYLLHHSTETRLPVPSPLGIYPLELHSFRSYQGWQDSPPSPAPTPSQAAE